MSYTSEHRTSCFGEFHTTSEPIAQKEHVCCECGKTIQKSEQYQYVSGLWNHDGSKSFATSKTCLDCVEMWEFVAEAFYENDDETGRVIFGMLSEAIDEGLESGLIDRKNHLIKKWFKRVKR